MDVLDVRVFPVNNARSLKGRANVTFGGNGLEVTVKGFRVLDDGKKEPWVGVPQERYSQNGVAKFKETLWVNATTQSQVYPKILEKYNAEIKNKVGQEV